MKRNSRLYKGIPILVLLCGSPVLAAAQQTATDFFKISLRAIDYKDYENVIFFANKALEINPKYAAAYWNRAIGYDGKNELDKSIKDYTTAITLYDNPTDLAVLYKNRGMEYDNMHKYDSAILDFNKAIEMNPALGYAYWNKGLAFDGLKKYDSAAANYTLAMNFFQPGGDLLQLYLQRGSDYNNLNEKKKAEADYRKVIKMATEPGYYSAYAMVMLDDKKGAIDEVHKFIPHDKFTPKDLKSAYFNAASIYSVLGNEVFATEYLDMALAEGYNDFVYISRDKDFDPMRDKEGFKNVIKKFTEKPVPKH